MPNTVDFLPFATAPGANVTAQPQWLLDPAVPEGFTSGILLSPKANKVHRQSSFVAAGVANMISEALGQDVLDDGNIGKFTAQLSAAIATLGAGGASGGITEAPIGTGLFYGRGNTLWHPVVPLDGGTMTGLLVLSGDPTLPHGAVTKQYADAISVVAGNAVQRAGDTMTGLLVLSGDPTAGLGAVTKQYADAINVTALAAVRRAGDTMTGLLVLSADPTGLLGAATKQYVDAVRTLVTSSYLPLAGGTISGTPGSLVIGAPADGSLGPGTLNTTNRLQVNNAAGIPLNQPGGPTNPISLRLVGDNTARALIEAYGAGNNALWFRRGLGTAATPTPPTSGTILGTVQWFSFAQTGISLASATAILSCLATENWSAAANGSSLNFATTANGATANAVRLTIGQGLVAGAPPDGDLGPGTLNAANLLQVNAAAGIPLGPPSGVSLRIIGEAGARALIEAYGTGNSALWFRRGLGTAAAPTPPILGTILGTTQWFSFPQAGVSEATATASFDCRTTENWSATANGSAFYFANTANGSTTAAQRLIIGQGLFVGTSPPTDLGPGTLVLNQNIAASLPPNPGTQLEITGADGAQTGISVDAFTVQPTIYLRRANGSAGAPATILNNQILATFQARGYATTGWSGNGPKLTLSAAENWSDTANGSQIVLATTPLGTTAPQSSLVVDPAGNLTILGATATKPGGGSWTAPSSRQVKRNIRDYSRGLEALRHLQPVTFEYNGENGTLADGRTYHGLIAETVAEVMPELFSEQVMRTYREIDGQDPEVTEYKTVMLDPTALGYALINAINELAARLETLEHAIED